MSIDSLLGNQRNKDVLKRLLRRRELGATLIFSGPSGVGKRRFAINFAKAANCFSPTGSGDDACDVCQVCTRIEAGTFSDVFNIEPDGTFIKIAQTRAIINEVLTRPNEGNQRFFVIDEADRMRGEAATSLLKTLEEPPPTSTLILVTSRPDTLLPTIRSRALRLNFTRLTESEMTRFLRANGSAQESDFPLLAHLAGGLPGRAQAFDLLAYRQQRQELISLISLLVSPKGSHRLVKAAEYYGKRERDDFERQIDLFIGILRDMLLLASGVPDSGVINIDAVEQLSTLSSLAGPRRLMDWVSRLEELRQNLRININRTLATEAALLSMAAAG